MIMSDRKLYLKQNVQVEPLFNKWYAWPYLVSPATAPMITANLHVNILTSYTENPELHKMAVENPEMLGGPFVDYNGERVDDIKGLLDYTKSNLSHLIEFSDAIKSLNNHLQAAAKGYSLEPIYDSIPEPLKGYVELVYDLNNNPSIRFIEGLLYKSPYYLKDAQSIALSLIDEDYRPFVMSTPRLEDDHHLHLEASFEDTSIDELFRMKETPQPLSYIKNLLKIDDDKMPLFSSFFTEEKTEKPNGKITDGVRVRYYGHACILIESSEVSVLTDPVISYEYGNGITRFTYTDLPESIDYLIITHNHQDHVLLETLLQIRHKVKHVIVPRNGAGSLEDPSLKLIMKAIGFNSIIEIDEMEHIDIPGGSITGIPFFGEHSDLNIRTKMAHLVKLSNTSFLCAADSNNLEPMLYEHVKDICGQADVLFLGMECDGAPLTWLYGPLLTNAMERSIDQSRRLDASNYERAAKIIDTLNCKNLYVYAMGQEPWLNYIMSKKYTEESTPIVESNKLIKHCKDKGVIAERLFGTKELLFD
jgi:L-ascorbate metabolism protein UlaG (beta-lactamase superfamily)